MTVPQAGSALPPSSAPVRLHYAWVIVAMTALVLLIGSGVRSAPGVLMRPWEQAFGWSPAEIGLAIAVSLVLYGLVGPFAGAMMDRLGLRKTILAALVLLVAGLELTSWMSAPWHLVVIWGVMIGSGSGMIAMVLGATVASRWFIRRRGLALGLMTAGTATGQLIFLPLLAYLNGQHGWRWGVGAIEIVLLAMIPLVAWLMRDRPADMNILPFGAVSLPPAPGDRQPTQALAALRAGLRRRDFWLIAGSFFICGASTSGLMGTHLVAACMDRGVPEVAAASILAGMGLFNVVGSALSGWLTDRYDPARLLFAYYASRGVSLFLLPFAFDGSLLGISLFSMFYGLDWIATLPPTARLTAKRFGEDNVGVYFGWIGAGHSLGAALAAWAGGLLRLNIGDYGPAFLLTGGLCFLAAGLVLLLADRPRPEARLSEPRLVTS